MQKQVYLPSKEFIMDYRHERKICGIQMLKVFETINFKLHGHYTHVCTVSKIICKSVKQGIDKWSLMIKNEYCCQIHSTYV